MSKKLRFTFCLIALISIFLSLTNAASAAGDSHLATKPNNTITSIPVSDKDKLSTPELIEQDFAKGKITNEQRFLYFSNKGDLR